MIDLTVSVWAQHDSRWIVTVILPGLPAHAGGRKKWSRSLSGHNALERLRENLNRTKLRSKMLHWKPSFPFDHFAL